ncbi:MAG: GNAT family N-acetyltransferase [Chitinispirillaceae bacterium]|nr:GNAT family N-acetyltransferase [Chitinispirillaceae bacterium]
MNNRIRVCSKKDIGDILDIINDAAVAYKNHIPQDCWHEPYLSDTYLKSELDDGVVFWGFEVKGKLVGVMGIQDRGEVTLIRHAYVRTGSRKTGIGSALLRHLESLSKKTLMVGTWKAAAWAISFYTKNGYSLVTRQEKDRLLGKYWSIPDRQITTSVVLVKHR